MQNLITWFSDSYELGELPSRFPSPFSHNPHRLGQLAAHHMQGFLAGQFAIHESGKMFGVLVVRDSTGRVGYLKGFSGRLAGEWVWPGFVPPIFEESHSVTEPRLIGNWQGERRDIAEFYTGPFKPEGVGECAGPKLLHYAQMYGLTPVAMAEFWWGIPPQGEVRHHGQFYPSCRGKCYPILPFMLRGIELEPEPVPGVHDFPDDEPRMVFEDADLVVVNKPSGMLSVPGKQIQDSVLTRLQHRYPEATGPLLLHRLDLATSGLLIAAKNTLAHKALQGQFESRQVEKRYVAVLGRRLPDGIDEGIIDLPLRVDMDDRPRQVVCATYGKPAKTRWRVIKRGDDTTRVYLHPLTGRTHQLRMHAAHRDGLDAPIVGDELYGVGDERLLLHAEMLRFIHPVTAKEIVLTNPAPF